jgi:peptidyl-prolyl cis-trans isomerase A (cyclophilin A)
MYKMMMALLLVLVFAGSGWAGEKVVMETSLGKVVLELDAEKAPVSVANFLSYVDEGFYNHTIFHRVISGFMIQGGGFDISQKMKPGKAPIKNEAANGLKNDRGTIAMARTNQVDSATSQFFINHADNNFLNYRSPDPRGFGYAVFGKVVEGMDVVDQIASQQTVNRGGAFVNLPRKNIEIIEIKRLN